MLNFKRLCFAAAAVSIGSSALAQVVGPNEGPSDVFLAVWNPATNQSIVQDLGISETTFESTISNNQQFQIDGSGAAFQSALTTGSSTSGVLWEVFAGNSIGNLPQNNINGDALDFTHNASITTLLEGDMETAASATGAYVDSNMAPSKSLVVASGATNAGYWAKNPPSPNPGKSLGLNGFDASGALGSSLSYYTALAEGPNDDPGDAATLTKLAGMWSLDNSTGKLSWTATQTGPQTPLPAAVWMFLSGLLGLGTVSRRKSA